MALYPAQARRTSLFGSGVSIGETSMVLSFLRDINGTNITMGLLGSKGYGTVEAGSGQEESISFTGITTNGDGTVTLTGVSSVLPVYPYSETSGFLKSHAGGLSFILSNTAGFYNEFVGKNTASTVTEALTFSAENPPRASGTVTYGEGSEKWFTTKEYVDEISFAGVTNATTSTKGLVEIATNTEAGNASATGSSGASLVVSPGNLGDVLQKGKYLYGLTGGGEPYTVTLDGAGPTAQGALFRILFNVGNTGPATLSVNGFLAKPIKKYRDGERVDIETGDIPDGFLALLAIDGDDYVLQQTARPGYPPKRDIKSDGSRSMHTPDGTTVVSHGLGVLPTKIRFTARVDGVPIASEGVYVATGNEDGDVFSRAIKTEYNGNSGIYASQVVHLQEGSASQIATVTDVTPTNITLSWDKTNDAASGDNAIDLLIEFES